MAKRKMEVMLNEVDTKRVEKRMGKAVAQLISDRINELPVEKRKMVYEGVFQGISVDLLVKCE